MSNTCKKWLEEVRQVGRIGAYCGYWPPGSHAMPQKYADQLVTLGLIRIEFQTVSSGKRLPFALPVKGLVTIGNVRIDQ